MHTVLTAKLKLHTTPDQFRALRQTQLAYRDALNSGSRYAFAHGKLSNAVGLQDGTYHDIRSHYDLPAQMACSVPRQVGATYQAPKYVAPTLTYQVGHDYTFKTEQRVSILTLDGRVVVPYTGYDKHVSLLQHGAHIGAAKLCYDTPRKQFYLLVSLEVEVSDPTPEVQRRIVGVDVGQRYLAVATDMQNHTAFFPSAQIRAQADHHARLRKRMQHNGTRSATRRLVVIAGRERRLKHERNHLISRRIVDAYPHSLIGLEDPTHIRERRKRKHGKLATGKQRRANRYASQWAFAELQGYFAYKALLAGSVAVKVDAYQTSRCCPRCGYTAEDNRPQKGLLFSCQECHLVLHADLVGARNVALRTLLARQDWVSTGVLSERPDVSSDEAKAVRRRRYAEWRWSPDARPAL